MDLESWGFVRSSNFDDVQGTHGQESSIIRTVLSEMTAIFCASSSSTWTIWTWTWIYEIILNLHVTTESRYSLRWNSITINVLLYAPGQQRSNPFPYFHCTEAVGCLACFFLSCNFHQLIRSVLCGVCLPLVMVLTHTLLHRSWTSWYSNLQNQLSHHSQRGGRLNIVQFPTHSTVSWFEVIAQKTLN